MTGTARVPNTELAGVKGRLLKVAVQRKLGRVPGSVEVMWNHPRVFQDLMRMGARTEK